MKVGVIGATGYAGAELVRILCDHPEVELTVVTSRQYAGDPFHAVYPSMTGVVDLVCETYATESCCRKADFFFTALPHKLSMAIVPELIRHGKRVVDLSADFRFRDVRIYEAVYQAHSAPEFCDKAVYGLSEIYRDEIRNADVIGNPGCYPTSALLPLLPLVKAGVIDPKTIIIDSKSGVSGAGRSPSLGTHFCEVNEAFKAYKIASHRHTPEIESLLSREATENIRVTFVPHLVPLNRGMLTTIYASLQTPWKEAEIRDCLIQFYNASPFVRICPEQLFPNVAAVRGTNFCDIAIKLEASTNRLIMVSAIDNLVKGAAGQAVQNMNLMLGIDETRGLDRAPFPL
ncbi:MAG: N-acetyl-gamma-glutamyl-phosphate reductase [Thermodesulfobacteriota bacterium]